MRKKECERNKVRTVMEEFKKKKLHSSSGDLVKNPKQAIAIALSVSRRYCSLLKGKGVFLKKIKSKKKNLIKSKSQKRRSQKKKKVLVEKKRSKKKKVSNKSI